MPVAETLLEKRQLTKFLQSVRANDRETIKKLIANCIANLVNYISVESPESALHLAAKANADDLVEFLLQLGADPDVVDFHGRSAAMKAAEYGHWQTVEKLVKAGGNMALTDVEGKGVLFYCIAPTDRHRRCASIVLQHKADANNISRSTVPILVQAAETAQENSNICLMLLDNGANPMSRTETTGRTAVMAASLSGNATVVKVILDRGGEVNQVMNYTNVTATHEAAKGGHVSVLQVLSAFGATFDVRDNQGNSPMHMAAQNGHGLACRFLAQRGCNPKPKNAEGDTARALAKAGGHKEALRECRKAERLFGKSGKNTEPWVITLYDYLYAMQDSLTEVFKKLASAESPGKIPREDFLEVLQGFPVQLPEETDLKKVISAHETEGEVDFKEFMTGKKFVNKQYLMSAYDPRKKKAGKGKGGRGKKGKTKVPFPICTQGENGRRPDGGPPIVYVDQHAHNTDNTRFTRDERPRHPIADDSRWYLDRPGEGYAYVSHAVKNVDLNTLRDAFERKKIDVNVRDRFYKTPLMVACLYGNIDLVKFLVGYGADVSAKDNMRWDPLHFACHCGLRDVVEYLLDLGANIESKALNGTTPLMRAVQTSSLEVVQVLLQRGAKLRVENRKEETPLDIAAAYADFEVYSLIKERWDALPVVKDKKKNRKRASARPKSTPAAGMRGRLPLKPLEEDNSATNIPEGRQRKGSILRTSSALGGGLEEREDITYSLVNTWQTHPTSRDLIGGREAKRERFSWEVDFADFKLPFLKNVARKIEEMGGEAKD